MLKFQKWFFIFLTFLFFTTAWAEKTGDALPTFSLPTLSGGHLTNKTLTGKVSLLNVWASWCRYCFYEHSMLMKIKNNFSVPIYGIILKDDPDSAKELLQRYGNPYVSVGEDPSGIASNDLEVYGTPQTFVVDKKGMIRYVYHGGIDQSSWNNTLWPLIKKLQAEKK